MKSNKIKHRTLAPIQIRSEKECKLLNCIIFGGLNYCEHCGAGFYKAHHRQVFCSRKCRIDATNARAKEM